MSEKMQETIADIIAEMLGARTEFPFVYLMGEPDTPEVIDPKTKKIIEPRKINIRRVTVKELADRLEAAHRRERGNAAKLREAMKWVNELNDLWFDTFALPDGATSIHDEIEDVISAALAETPRNCDMYANHNDAMKAFEAFVREQGKLGFINHNTGPLRWLFAPATEQEGGAK